MEMCIWRRERKEKLEKKAKNTRHHFVDDRASSSSSTVIGITAVAAATRIVFSFSSFGRW
jgi:hypothetical protein